jgi:ankyrin repeat-rich membrane spanning protein
MICGALQTLNEEAFEDVVGSDRPSPDTLGEMFGTHLAPIKENSEYGSPPRLSYSTNSLCSDSFQPTSNCNNNKAPNRSFHEDSLASVIVMPRYTPKIDDTKL